jgi:hypothetical protein
MDRCLFFSQRSIAGVHRSISSMERSMFGMDACIFWILGCLRLLLGWFPFINRMAEWAFGWLCEQSGRRGRLESLPIHRWRLLSFSACSANSTASMRFVDIRILLIFPSLGVIQIRRRVIGCGIMPCQDVVMLFASRVGYASRTFSTPE